ncbi:hypothetical protein [Vibrio sp. 10N.239.312.D08]|uniref:hypothetical protein n=1 Tax=Vibrio sp. 10N.239.312.D08 TaxID=3229978 RepID=UPI00354D1E37
MKKICLTALLSALVLTGCGNELKSVTANDKYVVPIAAMLEAQFVEGQRIQITRLGNMNPQNCYANYEGEKSEVTNRLLLNVISIECGNLSADFTGQGVGSDGLNGLRLNPQREVHGSDNKFFILVTNTLNLDGLTIDYYEIED